MAAVVETEPALLADGFVFGEGPRWHDGVLWFSDMHGEAVYTATLAGEVTRQVELPGKKPSGLGFLPDGSTLIVSMADRAVLRLERDGSVRVHAAFDHLVQDEINDMVVAPDGTAFVGTYSTTPDGGFLVRVTPDGKARDRRGRAGFPERYGHHRGWSHADRRRIESAAIYRVRPCRGRHSVGSPSCRDDPGCRT